MVDYYQRIAPFILPHLRGRPVTLKRYPDGVTGQFFFEKECPANRARWVHRASVWSESSKRTVHYCLIDNVESLLWLANLASLELHSSLARVPQLAQPTMLVFDLDPGPPATAVECARVALWLRDLLESTGLQAFPKSSGSKGVHLHVPLNTDVTYEETKPFAKTLASRLEAEHPDLVVSNMRRSLREGRVLVDWSQNDEHKTTVCVYSLRARERPMVAAPVLWEEIEQAVGRRDASMLFLDAAATLSRAERLGDLFEPVLHLRQRLAPSLR
jgi:bifunctional non-homologous end joining protein LigD